ncbi:Cutinase palindrome-binding protein [Gossypium australe]|uniref:Cutinase palindrome-binding protein n=1 Tax=Gossypium australe TaxID=47621 RepID=A0A5B6VV79_9ROSI|nr:Cutinase palindrome-binding protein [Gossypium australe]
MRLTSGGHLAQTTDLRAIQGKYVGASYIDARRREFLNLTQGDRPVAEYEAEFFRLSRYA